MGSCTLRHLVIVSRPPISYDRLGSELKVYLVIIELLLGAILFSRELSPFTVSKHQVCLLLRYLRFNFVQLFQFAQSFSEIGLNATIRIIPHK